MAKILGTYGVRWFSPEWLSGYALRCNEGYEPLTPKDHAAFLLLVGVFSSAPYDVKDPDQADELSAIRTSRGPYADRFPVELSPRDWRWVCGHDRMREVYNSNSRLVCCLWGDNDAEEILDDMCFGDAGDMFSCTLHPSLTRAHPVTSKVRQSCAVNVSTVASFSSAYSVPLYLRAMAWLTTRCRTGLGRVPHQWRGNTLFADIPTHRVADVLGFRMREFSVAQFTRYSKTMIADLRKGGIEATMEWNKEWKAAKSLRVMLQLERRHVNPVVYEGSGFEIERKGNRMPERLPPAPPEPKRRYVRKPVAIEKPVVGPSLVVDNTPVPPPPVPVLPTFATEEEHVAWLEARYCTQDADRQAFLAGADDD